MAPENRISDVTDGKRKGRGDLGVTTQQTVVAHNRERVCLRPNNIFPPFSSSVPWNYFLGIQLVAPEEQQLTSLT